MNTTTTIQAKDLTEGDILSQRGFAVTVTQAKVSGGTMWFTTDRFGTDYLPATYNVRVIR
jgi:hypothetical protein